MPKLTNAGSYIHDYHPTEIIESDVTEERIRELVKKHLGIEDLEWQYSYQIFMNKCFVDLGAPDATGITLALYNSDGNYSVRTYRKRAPDALDRLHQEARGHVHRIFGKPRARTLKEEGTSFQGPHFINIETVLEVEEGDRLLGQLEDEWWLKAMPEDGSIVLSLKYVKPWPWEAQ